MTKIMIASIVILTSAYALLGSLTDNVTGSDAAIIVLLVSLVVLELQKDD